jgi:hypothetical protein
MPRADRQAVMNGRQASGQFVAEKQTIVMWQPKSDSLTSYHGQNDEHKERAERQILLT